MTRGSLPPVLIHFDMALKKVLPVPRGLLLLGTDIVVTRSHLLATGYPAKVT